jgi:hypothetical protein
LYGTTSWVSTDGNDMQPGEVHFWSIDLKYGEVPSVAASPVIGPVGRILTVSNLQMASGPDHANIRFSFDVINAGPNSLPGYAIGLSVISQ